MELKYTRALLPGMFFDYDCVIIPGFGGFVCNERPAWYDDDKEEMVPPSRDILFNPNLTHNDGLLAQEIIRFTGVSYSEALKLAEEEAQFISSKLKRGNSVKITGLGRLYSGDDGVNRFAPDAELVRTLGSFGHSRIPLAKLQSNTEVKPESNKDKETSVVQMVPFRKKLAKVAAILALPIAAGVIIGGAYIASDNSGSNTLLSLFPSPEVILSTFSPSEATDLASFDETVDEEIKIDFVEPTSDPEETVVVVKHKRKVNFLIIGGAFAIEENAHRLADELRTEGYITTLHYQNHNKLHLVAIGEFEKEDAARKAMAKARRSGRKASWLKKLR